MGRFDNLDYEKAKEEGEKAAEDLSMFIAKRMKKDLDTIHVMFLELPSFGSVIYDGKASTKGQANVASYDKETGEYEGVFLLEMALKHMKRFLLKLEKPKYGIEKLY